MRTVTRFRAIAGLLVAVAVLVGGGTAAAQTSAQQPAAVAQLVVRLEVLEQELRSLRGELEAQRFRQRQLEAEIARLGGATGPASPAAPGSVDDPARGGTGTLGGGPRQPETAVDRPATGGSTPAASNGAAAAGGGSFQDGMALLQAGRYADARAQLDAYVAANPEAADAAEAAFWSAETLFFERSFQPAAAAFAANYRAFGPDAARAPDSLLKVAMSLNELGDPGRACQALDELARRHPDVGRSLEAAIGRERQRAGCG